LSAHGLKSAAAELYRTFCVIPPSVSFSIAWSIVRWHSGRWACVFWRCNGLLRPVQLAVEWWGHPHPNASLFPCNGLELKTRCPHVWSVYASKIDEKTTFQICAFYSACPSHWVAKFAFKAMRWKMEVASERLKMSMFVNTSLTFNSSILGRLWPHVTRCY